MNSILKKFLICIQLIAIAISVPYNANTQKALAATSESDGNMEAMYNWLIGNQLANGALPMYLADDGEAVIVPYFSSISTLAILEYSNNTKSLDAVKKYYDWYFAHLNYDGDDGGGSIYDYEAVIKDKEIISEASRADYDSADSYAALFLISTEKYIEEGGDTEYILLNLDKINLIIDLLLSLIDEDGLCRVSYTNQTKYLMDNCEVSAGLNSAAVILSMVCYEKYGFFSREFWSIVKKIINIRKTRNQLIGAIDAKMWNEEKQRYEIGIDKHDNVLPADSDDDFYPDAVAQIFPIVFGVLNPAGEK